MTTGRLLACILASVALSLGGLALVLGVADLAAASAGVWMRDWEKRGYVGDAEQWDRAFARVSLARRLNSLDADHSANLGRLMEWQSWSSATSSGYTTYRNRAAKLYAEAIGLRPTWGYAWAHYAENQFLLGSPGEEFLVALEKAMVLGPWEPGVQRKVAWIGMAAWHDLPSRTRILFEENIRRSIALDSNTREIFRFAIHFDWLDQLSPMLKTDNQLSALEDVRRQTRSR